MKSEDDQKWWLNTKHTSQGDCLTREEVSPPVKMVEKTRLVTIPPLPRCQDQAKDGGVVPEHAGMVSSSSNCGGVALAGQSQTRASDNTGLREDNDCVQNITAGKRKTGYVTINGINLMDIQRQRMSSDKKTTTKKTDSPKGRKKNIETTVPPSSNIMKYFTKKTIEIPGTVIVRSERDRDTRKTTIETGCGDEELRKKKSLRQTDNVVVDDECAEGGMKKTFSNIDMLRKKSVKESIRMFQDLVDDDECVMAGGWCGKHHVRLVRSISKKRISSVSEEGGTTWLRGEAVISACPYKMDKQNIEQTEAIELIPAKFEGTNGNKRFCGETAMNQSNTGRFEREET